MNLIRRLQNYDDPKSLASRFRAARSQHIRDLIERVHAEKGACRILDLGGRPEYWSLIPRDFLESRRVHVTTLNLEAQAGVDDPLFEQRTGDACATGFPDLSFDICHSNSVVEHVGRFSDMMRFAAETRRVAPRYYVQTPYYWFPVEPHLSAPFIHWLPLPLRAKIMLKRGVGFEARLTNIAEAMAAVEDGSLLDRAQMRHLFPDARLVEEKVLGLTKSLMAVRG
jgi:hypothetical protein